MELASRVASSFSSCEVASLDRKVEASIVFVLRGLKDDLEGLKLRPKLRSALRAGIATVERKGQCTCTIYCQPTIDIIKTVLMLGCPSSRDSDQFGTTGVLPGLQSGVDAF